jgi:group I intron endonuclease
MIIYKLTNKINGLSYIGQTIKNLNQRISQHLIPKKNYISNAIKKYGIESFDISIIDQAENQDILNEKEEYWISYYNTVCPHGYNLTYGGNQSIRSERTRRKMSESKQGKPRLRESVRKMVETRKQNGTYRPSEETCNKRRKNWLGEKNPSKNPEVIKKIIETRRKNGWLKNPEETHKRMSKALKGKSSGFKGKHHSEDSKQKMKNYRAKNRKLLEERYVS